MERLIEMGIAMVKEQITRCLTAYGYRIMLSDTSEHMVVCCKEEDGIRKAVCFINLKEGTILYKEHYIQLREKLLRILQGNQEIMVNLLVLFYTDYVDTAKRLTEEADYFWIIDARQKRLMVYEPEETVCCVKGAFDELIRPLEQCVQNISEAKYPKKKDMTKFFLATYILVAINLLVFFIFQQGIFQGNYDFFKRGANYAPAVIKEREYYRLITSMFLHADIEHLFNNMLLLCYIGRLLEEQIGKIRYVFVYFFSGMIAGLFSIGYNTHIGQEPFCIGASGAVFGLTGAMAVFVLWKQGRMAQISKRQMLIMVILSLYGGFVETNVDNAAHIGGLLAGAAAALVLILVHRRKETKKQEEGTSL